jgi:radical SAM protein with 4Fe4S-binding SPASM domain
MDIALFEKVIKQCRDCGVKVVGFHTTGEPLMHKEFIQQLEIAHTYGVPVAVCSNGLLLNEDNIAAMIKYPPVNIEISVDGATKESYESIRRGGNFEKLLKNLSLLRKKLNDSKSTIPLYVRNVLLKENIDTIGLFFDVFNQYLDSRNKILFTLANSLSAEERKDYFTIYGTKTRSKVPCGMLWSGTAVFNDGNVSACCRDYHGELIMGNINEQSLSDIWTGKKYQELRQKHLNGDVSDINMCSNCFDSAPDGMSYPQTDIYIHLLQNGKFNTITKLLGRFIFPSPLYNYLSKVK